MQCIFQGVERDVPNHVYAGTGGWSGICDTDGFCYKPQGVQEECLNHQQQCTDIFAVQSAYQGFVSDFVSSPDIQYFFALNKCV